MKGKKVIAFILAIVLLFSETLPTFAEGKQQENDYEETEYRDDVSDNDDISMNNIQHFDDVSAEDFSFSENTFDATPKESIKGYYDRAIANRVFMQESAGCSIASIACIEAYIQNKGTNYEGDTQYTLGKTQYYDIKNRNYNAMNRSGDALIAQWTSFGLTAEVVTSRTDKYEVLYNRLKESGMPVIIRYNGYGSSNTNQHTAVVVGYEDTDRDGIADADEFWVMESQAYYAWCTVKPYSSNYKSLGYITDWAKYFPNKSGSVEYSNPKDALLDNNLYYSSSSSSQFGKSSGSKIPLRSKFGIQGWEDRQGPIDRIFYKSLPLEAVTPSTEDTSLTFTNTPPIEEGKIYKITSVLSGKAIEVKSGNKKERTPLGVYSYAGDKWQKWIAKKTADGFSLLNAYTLQAIDIKDRSKVGGAVVQQYIASGNEAQTFKFVDAGNGKYAIVNTNSNMALDLWGSSMENDAEIKQYTYHGGDNQLWYFEEVSYEDEDEKPVSGTTLNMKLPSGSYKQTSSFDFGGSITSDKKITKIIMGISDVNNTDKAYHSAMLTVNSKTASWSQKDVSQLIMSDLSEGTYQFTIVALYSGLLSSFSKSSTFTITKKAEEQKKYTPTISATTQKSDVGDTYAMFKATVKNPGKSAFSTVGMQLKDEYGNLIGNASENVPADLKYSSVLYISYGTNASISEVNLGKKLTPGTKYLYTIYAFVGGVKYEASGSIVTEGSKKPATPIPAVSRNEYALGDVVTVSWDAISDATNGYRISLYSQTGSYVNEFTTSLTSAQFVPPTAGYYGVEIVAYGEEPSDPGYLSRSIIVLPNNTVTFVDKGEDGTENVLKTESVKYHGNATAPTAPSKKGWIFQGWDRSFSDVTEDITVYAKYIKATYLVTFVEQYDEDKATLGTPQKVKFGEAATPPQVTPREGYKFVGWDTEAYKCVEDNITVTACLIYEDENLPIQLSVSDCLYDSDGTGYTVHYSVQNYNVDKTTGRVIVSLRSSDGRIVYTTESNAFTLAKSAKKENVDVFVPYVGDAAYADVVIVRDFRKSVPISEKKTVNVTRSWSNWSASTPPAGTISESRTEYRYSDYHIEASSSPSKPGWNYVRTETSYGDYGNWSNWSTTKYTSSSTRQVEERTVTDVPAYTMRKYFYYKYKKTAAAGGAWTYTWYDKTGYSDAATKMEYHEVWVGAPNDKYSFSYWCDVSGHACYVCSPMYLYPVEYFYLSNETKSVPATTHKEYRYRDKTPITTYYFERWDEWSSWSTTPVTATTTRNVENRTVYRYQTSSVQADFWDGETYSYSGTVSPELAGKQIILVVFKNDEPADYNIEYLEQSTIGADGSYSFENFYTREIPSETTGDFTIKVGIEGSNELIYVGTIEAPKPVYTIRFVDWDGTELTTQEVTEGDSAVSPEIPMRPGYKFVGWDTGLSNIHYDMDILALYERVECSVIFVDPLRDSYVFETFYQGETIAYPDPVDSEGYEFAGWFDEYGNEITEVNGNIILKASYTVKQCTVNFYDRDNTIISSQEVDYGSTVIPPVVEAPEGQYFVGWTSSDYGSVNGDLEIYPIFAYEETTPNPKASVPSSTLNEVTYVSLSCPDKDATIFYTLDGTQPSSFSNVYEEPIEINKNVVLKFMAVSNNKNYSEVISEAYLLEATEDEGGALSIKKDRLNLVVGEEDSQVTYFLFHEDPEMGVQFFSLDDSIAVVDSEGNVHANNVGNTQVFAVTDDYRYADYCDIYVTSNEVKMESLDITQDDMELFIGEEDDLDTVIKPLDATYQEITWLTSDEDIVTVSPEGHIAAVGTGMACIEAQSYSGDNIAYCYVKVNDSTLSLSEQNVIVAVGQLYQLNATICGSIQNVEWKSNNTNVVMVDETGLLNAVGTGEATILATADNGDYRTCTVLVTNGTPASNPPDAPVADEITDTTISIREQEGCEYSIDGRNWQEETWFENLEPETTYIVYARYKETFTLRASSPSMGTPVTTLESRIEISEIGSYTYTGAAINPVPVVTYQGEELVAGVDYKLSYKNNTKVSLTAPTVTVNGINKYSGSVSAHFAITVKDISDEDITNADITLAFNKKVQKSKPALTYGTYKLKEKTDYTLEYPDTSADAYKAPGTYVIRVVGKNNFTGTKEITMTITESVLVSKTTVTAPKAVAYDGEIHKPELTIKYKGVELIKDTDYELSYPNDTEGAYTNPGTYTITVTGIGNYAGTRNVSFKINPISIAKAKVTEFITSFTYTGYEIEQDDMVVTLNEDVLSIEENYEVTYTKNVNVGTASVVIKGIGGYNGTIKKTYKITAYDISIDEEGRFAAVNEPEVVEFAKGGAKPQYEFEFNGDVMKEGTDYSIKYSNNTAINDGTNPKKVPTATITAKGNYKGKLVYTFEVIEQDIGNLEIAAADVVYKNKANAYKVTPSIVDLDGKKLSAGKDYLKSYVYTYADGTEIGAKEIPEAGSEIMVTVEGAGKYYGEISVVYRVGETSISKAKFNKIKKSYTGREVELNKGELKITVGKVTLVEGRDFEILEDTYTRNVTPGTASVTIRGTGSYIGTLKVKYTINKKKFY